MKIIRKPEELSRVLKGQVGLVPTMGAFHEGHLHLMQEARKECDLVVTSLFVNPTQFGPNEDFARYPRNEERDSDLAESVGVDILFVPSAEDMYKDSQTSIHVDGVTSRWEGSTRPTHFSGVATIVCKLFNIVRPNVAYFGLKDFQQCAVIKTMVSDLNMNVELRFIETVREASGLALSSRNQYLSIEEMAVAPKLYESLTRTAEQIRRTISESKEPIDSILNQSINCLKLYGFDIDYLALVDSATLEPVDKMKPNLRLIAAVRIGKVRLIDNVGV